LAEVMYEGEYEKDLDGNDVFYPNITEREGV